VRISANLKALTVEELRGRKRGMHLAAFDYAIAETVRTLAHIAREEGADERLQRDPYRVRSVDRWILSGGKEEDLAGGVVADGEVTFTIEGLLGKLRRECEAVRARHAAAAVERFADDAAFRAMVGEMLATGAAAVSCLRWYIEDPGARIEALLRDPLMTGHRGYLGYLARTLPAAGKERAAAAVRLCWALGVMGASVDEADADGLTLLMRAAADGAGARVLQSLAAARAELEARDGEKKTALFFAAEGGHAEAVEVLGQLGADFNAVAYQGFDGTPVWIAAQEGHVDVVEALGRLGADVNRAALDGRTPINVAAYAGHTAVVEALGRLRADVNLAGNDGYTPVCAAAYEGHTAVVEALGLLGADVNLAGNNGYTPVYMAAGMGHTAVVEALGRLGADVNLAEIDGETPLFRSRENGHLEAAAALERLGAR
jgi:ankyrin repeat protein